MTDDRTLTRPRLGGHFLGELHQRLEVPGASLSETSYPSGFSAGPHVHERAFLCFVLRGRYTESSRSAHHECGPFTAIFHPPGELHSDRFHSPGACFNVELTSPVTWDTVPTTALALGSSVPLLAARLYVSFRDRDAAATSLTDELLLELEAPSVCGIAVSRHAPSWLRRAIDWLESSEGTPCIRSLAIHLGLHPVYLARAFRRNVGCSPTDYGRQARLVRAAARLGSGAPPSQVAAEAGFVDQSHFHRNFRRAVGVAPGRWRRLIASDPHRQVARVQAGVEPAA